MVLPGECPAVLFFKDLTFTKSSVYSGGMEPKLDDWFTLDELAKKRGTGKENIRLLLKSRKVKTEKKGNQILVHKSEIYKLG